MVGLAWSVCRGGKEIGVPELFSGAADCVAYTCWHETPGKGPISDKNPAPVIEFLHWKAEQLRWNVQDSKIKNIVFISWNHAQVDRIF